MTDPEVGYPVPIRLGYWLVRSGVTCAGSSQILYRGIDRLPSEAYYDKDRLSLTDSDKFEELWDQYWDVLESGDLNSDPTVAPQLQGAFLGVGIDLDVVYAEVTLIPGEVGSYPSGKLWSETLAFVLPHRRQVHDRLGGRPSHLDFLGFDLSHPVPTFHSAIHQPGLDEMRPDYPDYLNGSGLFGNLDTALPFLRAANEMDYGPLPFCAIGVWEPVPVPDRKLDH